MHSKVAGGESPPSGLGVTLHTHTWHYTLVMPFCCSSKKWRRSKIVGLEGQISSGAGKRGRERGSYAGMLWGLIGRPTGAKGWGIQWCIPTMVAPVSAVACLVSIHSTSGLERVGRNQGKDALG